MYDLTKDLELPIAHKSVSKFAQNKIAWNSDGSALVTGDSAGNVTLFGLAERYRKMDNNKAENLKHVLSNSREDN